MKEAKPSINDLSTRHSLNLKKAPLVEQTEPTENQIEQEKEKVKKKKTQSRNKKKAIQDDDKENVNPENKEVPSSSKQKSVKAAEDTDTAVDQVGVAIPTAAKSKSKSKKANGKKKQPPSTTKAGPREPLTEAAGTELKQGEFKIDYEGLKDALGESFSLEDRPGPIHFAPLTSKAKIFHEKPLPKFSTSTVESSRTSNKSTPTAKSKFSFTDMYIYIYMILTALVLARPSC